MSIETRCVFCRAPRLDMEESGASCRVCGRAFEVCRGIPIVLDRGSQIYVLAREN